MLQIPKPNKRPRKYKSSPILSKTPVPSNLKKTARILKKQLQHHQQVDKSMLLKFQASLQQASRLIQNLTQQKQKLKRALSDTLSKKEQLYKQAHFLYSQLNDQKAENQRFRKQLSQFQKTKNLLQTLLQGLTKRDKIIQDLRHSNPLNQSLNPDYVSKIWQLAAKSHQNQHIRDLFKKHFQGSNSIKHLLQSNDSQNLASTVLDLLFDIIDYAGQKNKYNRDISPNGISFSALRNLPLQIDKVAKLNQEIVDTMEKSKLTLSPYRQGVQQKSGLKIAAIDDLISDPLLNIEENKPVSAQKRKKQFKPTHRAASGRYSIGCSSNIVVPMAKTEKAWGSISKMFKTQEVLETSRPKKKQEFGDYIKFK